MFIDRKYLRIFLNAILLFDAILSIQDHAEPGLFLDEELGYFLPLNLQDVENFRRTGLEL
jgi:hypothetical protein